MSTHMIIGIVAIWAVLAIAGIFLAAYVVEKINELKKLIMSRTAMLLDNVEKARGMLQGQMNEILETRIEVRKHSESLLNMFRLYSELEEQLWVIEKNMQAPADGEIQLPDLSEEFEEEIRKDWIENKEVVCRKLTELLRMTMVGEDIESIRYEKVDSEGGFLYEEYAVITWENGHKQTVTITADSGKAIISDVLKAI